jgi:hypothetical protein
MPALTIAGPSYALRNRSADVQRCINWVPVQIESGVGKGGQTRQMNALALQQRQGQIGDEAMGRADAMGVRNVLSSGGGAAELVVSVEDSVQIAPGLQALFFGGQWATVAAIGPCGTTGTVRLRSTNGGSGSLVVRMGALQIVEFDTERRAIEYYNAGFHQ